MAGRQDDKWSYARFNKYPYYELIDRAGWVWELQQVRRGMDSGIQGGWYAWGPPGLEVRDRTGDTYEWRSVEGRFMGPRRATAQRELDIWIVGLDANGDIRRKAVPEVPKGRSA